MSLALGAGWHGEEHRAFGFPFPPTPARMELFGEQLEIVRGLWAAGPLSFEGRHCRLGPVDPLPKPENPWLVVGGAAGPKSVALAARAGPASRARRARSHFDRHMRLNCERARAGAAMAGGFGDLRFRWTHGSPHPRAPRPLRSLKPLSLPFRHPRGRNSTPLEERA